MAGWLPLAISKDCGCNSKSPQDGLEMSGWLAPTSSKDVSCNCRSSRDGLEMAGLVALAISNHSGCNFGTVGVAGRWLGDGWKMAGRTPVVLEHPIQNKPSVQHNKTQHKLKTKYRTRWLGGWLLQFQT